MAAAICKASGVLKLYLALISAAFIAIGVAISKMSIPAAFRRIVLYCSTILVSPSLNGFTRTSRNVMPDVKN